MILILDNRDSFTFNLAHAFERVGEEARVVRAQDTTLEELVAMDARAILVGPGPGRPEQAALSLALFRSRPRVPLIGVCLGHQALAVAWGGRTVRSRNLLHGHAVEVLHDGADAFAGLPSPLRCGRYHSLTVARDELPACLEVTAHDADGEVLALSHRSLPQLGVQFHPESILSEERDAFFRNLVAWSDAVRPAVSTPATAPSTDGAARRPGRRGAGV